MRKAAASQQRWLCADIPVVFPLSGRSISGLTSAGRQRRHQRTAIDGKAAKVSAESVRWERSEGISGGRRGISGDPSAGRRPRYQRTPISVKSAKT